jgi:hypothetical protein
MNKTTVTLLSVLMLCMAHNQTTARDFKLNLPEKSIIITSNSAIQSPPPLPVNKYFSLSDHERTRYKRRSIAHIAMGVVLYGAAGLFAAAGKKNEDDSFINTSTPLYLFAIGSAATGTYFLTKGIIVHIKLNKRH